MDWLSEHAWVAWLGIAAVLGAAELVSLDLVLIMLAVGALAGGVSAALGAAVVAQVLVAGIASIALRERFSVTCRMSSGSERIDGRFGAATSSTFELCTSLAMSVIVRSSTWFTSTRSRLPLSGRA